MDDLPSKARNALIQRERKTARVVIGEFKKLAARTQTEINSLLAEIDAAFKTGANASFLIQRKQLLDDVLNTIRRELRTTAKKLSDVIESDQNNAIDIAARQAASEIELEPKINFFDLESTREIAGQAGDGSPLKIVLERLAAPIQTRLIDALTFGIAAGMPTPQIAAEINSIIPANAANAMTFVRTETNRAYRETNRKFYASIEAARGWRWVAALDLRTCPICWALHGRIFPTSEKMATHPNCRCVMAIVLPKTKSVQTGAEKFANLSAAEQTAILGKKRFGLFQSGISLSDFVGKKDSPFGETRYLIASRDLDVLQSS